MFKIFMKRSHPPFDCPIAGFYFRVAFTVLNASSLHMRIPNQQRAPCETPWGGSTAATVSALSPTHVRRDLLSTQINVRPAAYLTHTRVPRTKTLKRPDIILFSIALKFQTFYGIFYCVKYYFIWRMKIYFFFSNFSLPSPKRTPKPQNHAHLSFRLRVTFCSQRTFSPLQWLWSRPTHPCCLPSSAPRALSQSQLPCQAPLVPPSLTPHNTVDSLAYFSVGAAGPCCSTPEDQDLLAPGAARLGKTPVATARRFPGICMLPTVTLRHICSVSVLLNTVRLEPKVLFWLRSIAKEGAPATRDLQCFGFSPGSLYYRTQYEGCPRTPTEKEREGLFDFVLNF